MLFRSLMSHFALHVGLPMKREVMGKWLREKLTDSDYGIMESCPYYFDVWNGSAVGPELGKVTSLICFDLLIECGSLLEILRRTIEIEGDTDSVAAIAMAIGSTRKPDDLPAFMHNNLEVGTKFGSKRLKDFGKKLIKKFA